MFNTRDETLHKKIKKPIAPLYSLSNLLRLEPVIDDTITVMTAQIDQRFEGKETIFDLGDWLQYFAFEVMGTISFSKRYGFLEQGEDINNMIHTVWEFMYTAAPVSPEAKLLLEEERRLTVGQYTQIPWFDDLWNKTAITTWLRGKTTGMGILGYVVRFIAERKEALASEKGITKGSKESRDLLAQFIDLTQKDESLPPW